MDSVRRRATFRFSEEGEEEEDIILDEQGEGLSSKRSSQYLANIAEEQDEVIQQLREQSERLKEKGLIGARILVLLSSILYAPSHFTFPSFDQSLDILQTIHPIIGPNGE